MTEKLELIRNALKSNNNIILVDETTKTIDKKNLEEVELPPIKDKEYPFHLFCQSVSFYVAPNGLGIYTADGMNRFMHDLIPDLKLEFSGNFFIRKPYKILSASLEKDEFVFGYLQFWDNLGSVSRTYTFKRVVNINENIEGLDVFSGGKKTIEDVFVGDVIRRISIHPFPDKNIARVAIRKVSEHPYLIPDKITLEQLEQYQRNYEFEIAKEKESAKELSYLSSGL